MEEKELQEALKKEEDLKAYFRQLKSVAVVLQLTLPRQSVSLP